MSRAFEIVIPHPASKATNAACLKLCQARFAALTPPRLSGKLTITVVNGDDRDPYLCWNERIAASTADVVILTNDDMIAAPGWHSMLDAWRAIPANSIVTGYMVEPGRVPTSPVNDQYDFGASPASFDAAGFDAYVAERAPYLPHLVPGMGWLQPFAIARETFNTLGGYDMTKGSFPDPLDVDFVNRARAAGCQFLRANSWWYHFQRVAHPEDIPA